jgi:hypothetical protein
VSYTSVDRDWSQWGYGVSIDRSAAEEFSSLTDGSPKGFLLTGSGTATVTTPADYEPGRKLTVTVDGPAGSTTSWVRAGPSGRINVVVPLGSGGRARVTIGS